MQNVPGVRISVIPPGTVVPPAVIDWMSTWASREGRSRSVNDAASEVLPLPAVPALTVACTLTVPVKEVAALEVCAASRTASSGVVGAAAEPPVTEPQAVRVAARIAVSPAAYSGMRAARACTEHLHLLSPGGATPVPPEAGPYEFEDSGPAKRPGRTSATIFGTAKTRRRTAPGMR